jgi:hypothetical protein
MENNIDIETKQPPRLIASITEGFNSVASHIYLILFPLVFDVFLWLGPHLRIKNLLQPYILNLLSNMPELTNPDLVDMTKWSKELWGILLDHFNLISLVKVFPLGLPSLMTGLSPIKTPYGSASLFEMSNFFQVILVWGLFTTLGIILGSLYFDAISRSTNEKAGSFSISAAADSTLQIFFFTVLCFIILLFFAIPTLLLITLLSLISTALGQIALLFICILLIWFVMPLIFSTHGVFVKHQLLYSSITTSIRLVRNYLPGTGMFILTALLLYQGLNLLWETAPETSWMSLIGIFGHAFISTGLIASSFVYYRKGLDWMESRLSQVKA